MNAQQTIDKLRLALQPFADLLENPDEFPLTTDAAGNERMATLYVCVDDIKNAQQTIDEIPPEFTNTSKIKFINQKVRLTEIQGDQEEFADLLGTSGILKLNSENEHENTYFPHQRGDWLTLAVQSSTQDDDKIIVKTTLDNTFTFRKVK